MLLIKTVQRWMKLSVKYFMSAVSIKNGFEELRMDLEKMRRNKVGLNQPTHNIIKGESKWVDNHR